VLFIISGPSGAGKTTLYKKVTSSLPNVRPSVSYTTRTQRSGEVNDRDYTFITRDEFKAMIDRGEFIEWAEVHGELYGTSQMRLDEIMNSGADAILDIDTQGVMQLKNKYREGVYIFICPPSITILKERLKRRLTDSKEVVERRIKAAVQEIKQYRDYDYVIVNDVLEEALRKLEAIIISHRVSTKGIDHVWIENNFFK
jgi:guanylate kinase